MGRPGRTAFTSCGAGASSLPTSRRRSRHCGGGPAPRCRTGCRCVTSNGCRSPTRSRSASRPRAPAAATSIWSCSIARTAGAARYGVYVGMSRYSPAQRFDQHKAGIRAAGSVLKRGLEVLTGPTLHLQRIARPEAVRIEAQLAEALGDAGLLVAGWPLVHWKNRLPAIFRTSASLPGARRGPQEIARLHGRPQTRPAWHARFPGVGLRRDFGALR